MRRSAEEIAKMRRAGRVVAEMHEATREAAKPGVTTAELDAVARDVLDAPGRQVQLPALPGVSGGDLHVAQRHDRPRHPRRVHPRRRRHLVDRLWCHHRGLPRRRGLHHGHRGGVGRGRPTHRDDRAQPVGRDRAAAQRQPPPRGGPGRPGRGRGGRVLRGPGVRRPRHRHGHARGAPGAQLLARPGRARCSSPGWSSPWSPW